MTGHHIGSVEDFPEGKGVGISIGELSVAVFNIDGEFYGILNNCLHKNYTLHEAGTERFHAEDDGDEWPRGGIDAENCRIKCPWHHLEWDLETGYSPALDKHIPTYEVQNRDGELYITV